MEVDHVSRRGEKELVDIVSILGKGEGAGEEGTAVGGSSERQSYQSP